MVETLRVGLIGANPQQGWAAQAHLPALAELPGVELSAVATTRQVSADEAARRFGARHAFADAHKLIGHPDVDVVAVAVQLPHHDELVTAALDAGKHVFCEWPLAVDARHAEQLRDLARHQRVHHMVGLQGRRNPAVNYVRDLVTQGLAEAIRTDSPVEPDFTTALTLHRLLDTVSEAAATGHRT